MSIKILNQIKQAELEAEKIENEAITKAGEIIANTNERGKEILDSAIVNSNKEAQLIIKKSEEEAKLEIESMLKQLDEESNDARLKVKDKIDEVAKKILGRIVKAHVNN